MEKHQAEAQKFYGNRIRVRVCGICVEDDKVLMIGHKAIVGEGIFWCPPGGGIDENETLEEGIIREFREETGLNVEVEKFLFINEFIKNPLHGVEAFFLVKILSGELSVGYDPEMPLQIIDNIAWMSLHEIKKLPETAKHSFWNDIFTLEDLLNR